MAKRPSPVDLFEFDRELCGRGEIAGADEAGRGCLAGPMVAAAVVFDHARCEPEAFASLLAGLSDSKKLTPQARERVFPLIARYASRFSIVTAGRRTIDEEGLHKTNLRALGRSLVALAPCPEIALVDGRQELPDNPVPHTPVTGGDSRSACIAAASVIAKVTRDRLMHLLHPLYPEYGLEKHVGYATRDHRAAIARYGMSFLHRRSFSMGPLPEADGER